MTTVKELLQDPGIAAYLHRLIGDEGMELIQKFPEENEYSDEDLAEQTEINLNTVRNTLYTLYENRLAKYRRIKNNETGWLTYLWQLQFENIFIAIERDLDLINEKLKKRQVYETENSFYLCKPCGLIITFDNAMDSQFACPQCEGKLDHFDNEPLLNALNRRIEKIQKNLGYV